LESILNRIVACLTPIQNEAISQLKNHFSSEIILSIEDIYSKLVNGLLSASAKAVSVRKTRGVKKHWWNKDLNILKSQAIASWLHAGRPNSGPLYLSKSAAKSAYKARISLYKKINKEFISDNLNNLLLDKPQQVFWKVWKSNFGVKHKLPTCIDGRTDCLDIANLFVDSFGAVSNSPVCNISSQSTLL